MKYLKIFILLLSYLAFYVNYAVGQSVGVNVANPSLYAALDIASSPAGPQGVLLSRLTTSERFALTPNLSPAEESLLVFDSDLHAFYWWDGAAWQSLNGSGSLGQVSETNGLNASTQLSMNYNASSLVLTDITQSVTTGSTTPAVKLSGIIRTSGSGFTYSNLDQLGLVTVNSYLQRATDANFTADLVDLQIGRCNPYFKLSDSRNTSTTVRLLQFGAPCTIPVEYYDDSVLPNSTYFYRIIVTLSLSGQQPTAGTINIQDRSLIIANINN